MIAPTLPLPLDESRRPLRHLRDQQLHREPGQRQRECDGQNQNEDAQSHCRWLEQDADREPPLPVVDAMNLKTWGFSSRPSRLGVRKKIARGLMEVITIRDGLTRRREAAKGKTR